MKAPMQVSEELVDAFEKAIYADWMTDGRDEKFRTAKTNARNALIAALRVPDAPQGAVPIGWIYRNAFDRLVKGCSSRETVHEKMSWPNDVPLFASPPPSEARVPEGWKLVPKRITREMIDAHDQPVFGAEGISAYMQVVWDRILAAAPLAPSEAWQTMDSAPKDGDPVLLEYRSADDGRHYYCVTHWVKTHWRGYYGFDFTRWSRPFPTRGGR